MADARDWWIYREGRESRSSVDLTAELECLVAAFERSTDDADLRRRRAVDAAIASGVLEAALTDAGADARATKVAAMITDVLASAALGIADGATDLRAAVAHLIATELPARLVVSTAEGFAYYALHPEAFAVAVRRRPRSARGVLVVGVRSIGTTLSAFVRAELVRNGEDATRITVRPTGPASDRRLDLGPAHRDAVLVAAARGAEAIVVDEGPGLSGSTLLATAEALERAGMPCGRITVLCSNAPPPSLAARDAAARFARFTVTVAPSDVRVPPSQVDLSAGAWRCLAYEPRAGEIWPASFTQTERRKLLMPDGRLAKFEGMGSGARRAIRRGEMLASAGFSPPGRDEGDGWLSYAWEGPPLARDDLDGAVLDRMAEYCAMRPHACPVTAAASASELEAMVAKNLGLVTGAAPPSLRIERLAIVDARMAPHEWIRRHDGSAVKTDAIAHGDDHFFPGPTDIAWDLAGALVEWELDAAAAQRLLSTYRRASGDDIRARLPEWILAYATFRLAFTSVGRSAAATAAEDARLAADQARYHRIVCGVPNGARRPGALLA
jgi:hypothetical protein